MVSVNISEIKPRGLTDRLEEKGEKIELKTLKLKSNGVRKQRLYLEKQCSKGE